MKTVELFESSLEKCIVEDWKRDLRNCNYKLKILVYAYRNTEVRYILYLNKILFHFIGTEVLGYFIERGFN